MYIHKALDGGSSEMALHGAFLSTEEETKSKYMAQSDTGNSLSC